MGQPVKVIAGALMALLVQSSALWAGNESDARELVAMWNPTSVEVSGGQLTIILPQRRITEEIYYSLLTAGLCLGPLYGKSLPGVSEVRVLNEFGRQGYVYEKGLEDCETFTSRPVTDPMTKIEILGATHLN